MARGFMRCKDFADRRAEREKIGGYEELQVRWSRKAVAYELQAVLLAGLDDPKITSADDWAQAQAA
jgi:hypothetical protein